MADFPEHSNVNPVLPPSRPRETGKRKRPVGERDAGKQQQRRKPPPDEGHVLDEYA